MLRNLNRTLCRNSSISNAEFTETGVRADSGILPKTCCNQRLGIAESAAQGNNVVADLRIQSTTAEQSALKYC